MIETDERVKRTEMFQRWMAKRGRMRKSIAGLLIVPSIVMAVAGGLFWFQYYIPVPMLAAMVFLGVSAACFAVCLVIALAKLKRLSEGDKIMWKMKLDSPESS
jgi:ABC-type spermidine/putrescine transport system permease subunit II